MKHKQNIVSLWNEATKKYHQTRRRHKKNRVTKKMILARAGSVETKHYSPEYRVEKYSVWVGNKRRKIPTEAARTTIISTKPFENRKT